MSDSTRVMKGYEYQTALSHNWDSTYKVRVTDEMTSSLKVWYTAGSERTGLAYDGSVKLPMAAWSFLAKENYAITASQVDIEPSSSTVIRGAKDKDTYVDTCRWWFPDGQVLSVPVEITTKDLKVAEDAVFSFPSLRLQRAQFAGLTNQRIDNGTRAMYRSASYRTTYKVNLFLTETEVEDPEEFVVPVYAYTERYVMSEDDIVSRKIDNVVRVGIDTLTERCALDVITTYKSGQTTAETYEHIMRHRFYGIDPYDKIVGSFSYTFKGEKGITIGAEEKVSTTDARWQEWTRTDISGSTDENGVAADTVEPVYYYRHGRCVFTLDSLSYTFDYVRPEVTELGTGVTSVASDKDGYKKAVLNNAVSAEYLSVLQTLSEKVNLYMKSKDITGYEIANAEMRVIKDSVIASVDFITRYSDGTEETVRDRWSQPRSLKAVTNWTSEQSYINSVTDSAWTVTLKSSENRRSGYWQWVRETRNVSCYAHLYNGEAQRNAFESVVPNKLVYVREGKRYEFKVLDYKAVQRGASTTLKGDEGGYTIYNYIDVMEENFGGYPASDRTPGTIRVPKNSIFGYEIRNKNLIITTDSVKATLDFVTKFTDGSEDVAPVAKSFTRSLVCTSDWRSNEANANQTTGAANVTVAASQNRSDDEWNWVERTRSITTAARLAGSVQYNQWTSVDPDNIAFTRNGISTDFGSIPFTAVTENSNVNLKSKEGLSEIYAYDNSISVRFGDNRQFSTAPGTIVVEKDRTVTGHEFRDGTLVVYGDSVVARLAYVTLYNDNTEDRQVVSRSFPRTLNVYTDWTSKESDASVLTESASVNLTGSNVITDGNWGYTVERRQITTDARLAGSTQVNGVNAVDPNYVTYTRDGQTYEFGKVEFSAAEAGQSVTMSSDGATQTVYAYTDKISVTFGSNTQTVSAPGKIIIAKEKTVTGYEIRNQKLTVGESSVTAFLSFITKWSDGTETSEDFSKVLARSFTLQTDWSSDEDNAQQSTSSASVSLTGSEDVKDGNWSYVSETRGISTEAVLSSSVQNNRWISTDPNKIVFTKDGRSYSFGTLTFGATENGAVVAKSSEDDKAAVYSYTDNISVSYGGNTFSATAPGKISVRKSRTVTGYEIANAEMRVIKDSVIASVDFVTRYSDGTGETVRDRWSQPRSLKAVTNWTSEQNYLNSNTDPAWTVTVKNSESKSDGYWSWIKETRDISCYAHLYNGEAKRNAFESVVPNKLVYVREGKRYEFNVLDYKATQRGASTTLKGDEGGYTVYHYIDVMEENFGGYSASDRTPGTIRVKKTSVF